MQIVLSTRLGGPGIDRWPTRRLRRALKTAFEPLAVETLDTIDLALTIGGSVTPAEGDAGVHNVRHSMSKRLVTANLVVPASTVAAHAGDVLAAVRPVFLSSLPDALDARLRRKRVPFDRSEFTTCIESAFELAARPDQPDGDR